MRKQDLYFALALAAKARQDAYNESVEVSREAAENVGFSLATRKAAYSKTQTGLMLAKAARCEAEAMLKLYDAERLSTSREVSDA